MKWTIVLTFLWITSTGSMQITSYEREVTGMTKAECAAEAEKVLDSLEASLASSVYGVARARCMTDRPLSHT